MFVREAGKTPESVRLRRIKRREGGWDQELEANPAVSARGARARGLQLPQLRGLEGSIGQPASQHRQIVRGFGRRRGHRGRRHLSHPGSTRGFVGVPGIGGRHPGRRVHPCELRGIHIGGGRPGSGFVLLRRGRPRNSGGRSDATGAFGLRRSLGAAAGSVKLPSYEFDDGRPPRPAVAQS